MLVNLLGILLLVWLIVLTYFYFKERNYLKLLFPQDESRDIRAKLREVVGAVDDFKKENTLLAQKLDELTHDGMVHLQKLEIVRYNPYNDTGGDQSFSVVLLDGRLNGLLLTSLHSRAGTRIYTKIIKSGKSDLDLSKEEKELLIRATDEKKT
jgi:hypothetical protein